MQTKVTEVKNRKYVSRAFFHLKKRDNAKGELHANNTGLGKLCSHSTCMSAWPSVLRGER